MRPRWSYGWIGPLPLPHHQKSSQKRKIRQEEVDREKVSSPQERIWRGRMIVAHFYHRIIILID